MQPQQPQPTDWQPPTPQPSAAPFQVPEPASEPQFAQQLPPQPIAPEVPQQPQQNATLADVNPPAANPYSAAPVQAPAAVEQPQVNPAQQPTEYDQSAAFAAPTSQQPVGYSAEPTPDGSEALLRWEGTEYLGNSRSTRWYIIFAVATVLAVIAAIVLLKSITFAILIPVMVVALLVYVRRAPDVLQYTVSRKGIHVNDKLFAYSQFKAFGVAEYNNSFSVILVPRKRFQIGQTLYFPQDIGEQLVDMLAERLPMQDVAPDAVDRLLAKLHL